MVKRVMPQLQKSLRPKSVMSQPSGGIDDLGHLRPLLRPVLGRPVRERRQMKALLAKNASASRMMALTSIASWWCPSLASRSLPPGQVSTQARPGRNMQTRRQLGMAEIESSASVTGISTVIGCGSSGGSALQVSFSVSVGWASRAPCRGVGLLHPRRARTRVSARVVSQ